MTQRNPIQSVIYTFLALTLWSGPAQAQVLPKLDVAFNQNGFVTFDSLHFFEPGTVAVTNDGKILVAGYGNNDELENYDGLIYQINDNGGRDFNFGNGGGLRLDVDGSHDQVTDLEVLPDGKILLVLESTFRTILLQLNPDGSFDTNFGNDGVVLVETQDYEYVTDMVRQPDGKLLLLSTLGLINTTQSATVRRCFPDGTLDESFGTNGRTLVTLPNNLTFEPKKIILQPDGKILFTGQAGAELSSAFPVVRLKTDGSLDNTFSGDGIYLKTLGVSTFSAVAYDIAVSNEGKIFVTGESQVGNVISVTIMALSASGNPIGTFGQLGITRVPIGYFYSSGRSIIIQDDNKILVGGFGMTVVNQKTEFALTRLTAAGQPDLTFGDQQGRIQFPFQGENQYNLQIMSAMTLDHLGRIVCGGWLRQTIILSDESLNGCSVFRLLSDIMVKAEEPSTVFMEAKLTPNPVTDQNFGVVYDLDRDAAVEIALYDGAGRLLHTLKTQTPQTAGHQNETLRLPEGLAAGQYYIGLHTEAGSKILKMTKI